jgi:hypothetical protein
MISSTCAKNDNTLIAQASGQSSFPLEATELDKFKFDQAGIVMEFNPSEKTRTLFRFNYLMTMKSDILGLKKNR